MATQQRSRGLFPNTASTDDDAGLLTSSFKSIVGLASAKTAQINIVASFASEDDEVIVQVQNNGVTKNLTFGWNDFKGDALATFVAEFVARHQNAKTLFSTTAHAASQLMQL